MGRSINIAKIIQALWISGVRLRCPNCGKGTMFRHLFKIEDTCDVCSVRFERLDGESLGGIAITMGIVPPASLAGYFIVDALFDISWLVNAGIWLVFIVVACTLIYRHSRAAWVGISYLTGGVYADPVEPDTSAERARLVEAVRTARGQYDSTYYEEDQTI